MSNTQARVALFMTSLPVCLKSEPDYSYRFIDHSSKQVERFQPRDGWLVFLNNGSSMRRPAVKSGGKSTVKRQNLGRYDQRYIQAAREVVCI